MIAFLIGFALGIVAGTFVGMFITAIRNIEFDLDDRDD